MKKHYTSLKSQLTFKLSILFVLFGFFVSSAQVTTNSGSGLAATYPDLASAVTALNGATISSPVVITLTGDETAPAGGYSITAQGDAVNTIIIEGATSTITANAALTAGTLNDAIFKLVGADYVTIQGFTMLENPANTTTAAATNNMTEWGVALLYATTSNGAQNNTIQNNTIDLNRTYQNTFGIYCNATHSATAPTTSATAIAGGGNNGLKVYANNITDVNIGILVVGPTAAANHNDGIDIGGTSLATGNVITNFGTTGTFSGYANVSGSVNGILVRNSKNFNVSYNSISSSNGGVAAGTLRGVFIPAFNNAPTGAIVNTINNNIVSLRTGFAGGAIVGIINDATTVSTTTTLSINNNDFNNFGHTVSGTGAITLISNVATTQITNINSNTFTNLNVNTTGSFTFITNSVTHAVNSITNVNNNSVITAFAKTGAGGTVYFYDAFGSTIGGSETNIGNNFSNITLTGATTLGGFRTADGATPYPSKTVTNNVFNNIVNGAGAMTILNVGYSAIGSSNNVSGNTISNISGGAGVIGITSAAGDQAFFNNTINGLGTSGANAVSGISITGGTTQNLYKNKIFDIQCNNASGTVNGIVVSSGTTTNIYNNIIGDLRAPIANAANPVNGLNITGGTNVNAYHNSIYLNATSAGALFGSSAVFASSTPTVTLRNNIFINNSTVSGAGLAVAYRRSSATLTSYAAASDNNIFYASNIFTDGTNTDATLAAYKTRVGSRDAASQTEDTSLFFQSTLGSDLNYLRIPVGTTTFAESGAVLISSPLIDTDYWGITRPFVSPVNGGTTPDIGASEFDGIPNLAACVAPVDQATALVIGATTATTTAGSFNAATSAPAGYLVVASTGVLSTNPVNGTGYAPGNVLGNGIVVQSGPSLSYSATGLTGNTEYTITVFSYNSGSCSGGPAYLTSSPLSGTVITCPAAPTVLVNSLITSSDFTASWTAPVGGSAGVINYTMDVATDAAFTSLVGGSPISVGTATTQAVSGLLPAVTYYIRVKANNGSCDSAFLTGTVTTLCLPATLTTVDGTRCGTGSVELSGSASSGNVVWYAAPTGGTPLFTGNVFNTPSISTTTQYYAESQIPGAVINGARLAPATISGTTPSSYGLVFNVTSAFTLNSVDVFNSTTSAGTFTIQLQDNTGAVIQTSSVFTAPAGTGVLATTVAYTANLGWNIPVGTGYRLLVTTGTASLIRESALGGFPYALGTVGSITNGYIAGTSTTYYYLYNWQIQTVCSSTPREEVTATVTSAPAITASGNVAICNGESTTLNVSSANDPNYVYTWSPATGLSATTGASVTANPTATTTYTVTANDAVSGCVTSSTIVVTVNPTPSAISITPASPSICVDAIQSLSVTGGTIGSLGSTTIGTDTTVTTQNGIEPTAFNNRYEHYWMQMVFTAAELNAAGVQAGSINGIKFNITTIGSATFVSDYRVHMGNTGLSALTGFVNTGLTEVFSAATYNQQLGVNTITFNTPYVWDGVSNIILDIRNTGADSTNNSSTYYTATSDNKTVSAVTTATFASSNAFAVSNPAGTLSLKRLNTTFDWDSSQPTTITWSPVANLYTDAAATTPYVAGDNATTVYVKSATAATTTYTTTSTAVSGCDATATVDVIVNPNTTNSTTITACDTYTWAVNGSTYTSSGIYTNVVGCHTETLDLTITPSSSLPTEVVSVCDTYTWAVNGTTYTTSGVYTSVTNCVTSTLDLTITPSSSLPTEVVSVCDTYTWAVNGTTYTTSGVYTSVTNCVTSTLDLTITPSSSLPTEVVSVCDTYTWAVNGTTYTTSGVYTSVTNCVTSTLDLTINVSPSDATTQTGDTLTATETGATYQWVTCDGGGVFTPIGGAMSQSYLVTAIGSYAVEVTKNGCTVRSACIDVTSLSGNTFDLTSLTYYPNPVVDIFTVKYDKEIESINVFDLSGRLVRQLNPKQLEVQVDMSELAAAMYIVKVNAGGKQTEIKVMKK